jgi:hypothetical protein
LTTLLAVVNDQRSKRPSVAVAYHDLTPSAEGAPGSFTLSRVTDVVLVVKGHTPVEEAGAPETEGGVKPPASLQVSAGALVPLDAWVKASTSPGALASLVWSMKWTQQGLMPVRAQIVTTTAICLSPVQAVSLFP